MITFDSFTLVPQYSETESRSAVDISTSIRNRTSMFPVINANMHSICTPGMVESLSTWGIFNSYHRFFESKTQYMGAMENIKSMLNGYAESFFMNNFFPSIGIQEADFSMADWLADNGFANIIIDVNHGHHLKVKKMVEYVRKKYPDTIIMAGNVCTNDGIDFLADAGANIIKIGNSFGSSCSTLKCTSMGIHPMHAAIEYREAKDNDVFLCIDGGIRNVGDIAKSLVFADLVMIGRMFAGTKESNGKFLSGVSKEYYGNASVLTKAVDHDTNHIRYIEGEVKAVPFIGHMKDVLISIKDGLQSAFSFSGAANLKEFQAKTKTLF